MSNKINLSFEEYRKLVSEAIEKGTCLRCHICSEPRWENDKHICWEVQNHGYPSINIAEQLKPIWRKHMNKLLEKE